MLQGEVEGERKTRPHVVENGRGADHELKRKFRLLFRKLLPAASLCQETGEFGKKKVWSDEGEFA